VQKPLFKLLVRVLIGASVCSPAVAQTLATIVWYSQQERGIEPYQVRYVITSEYMRSDDRQSGNDFLLFDRRQRKIYSVAVDNHTILEVDGNGEAPLKPDDLSIAVQEHIEPNAPMIDGKPTFEVRLVAADQVCHSAMVVANFLEPVRKAMQEYSQALAVQQQRTLDHTPIALQTPCFLARYLYAGDFALAKGLVLADWNSAGERRELTGYETEVPVADTLFVVPADFRRISAAAE
jgi:hypothetical protein